MNDEHQSPRSIDELTVVTTDYIPALEYASNTMFQHTGPQKGYFIRRGDHRVESFEMVRCAFVRFKAIAQRVGIASA